MMMRIGLSVGNGGWVRVSEKTTSDERLWYGRAVDVNDRLVLDELYATGGLSEPFPIEFVETWINLPEVAGDVRGRIHLPGPDLRRAASYYASTFGERDQSGRGAHWAAEMLLSQLPAEDRGRTEPDESDRKPGEARAPRPISRTVVRGVARPPMLAERDEAVGPREWAPVDAFVDCPPEPPYGVDFYGRVARAHGWLVNKAKSAGDRPAPAPMIARANGVPITTAHKWIREAKRLGLIAVN